MDIDQQELRIKLKHDNSKGKERIIINKTKRNLLEKSLLNKNINQHHLVFQIGKLAIF